MTQDQIGMALVMAEILMRDHPDEAGALVKAMQSGLQQSLEKVQIQRGEYASALANLSQLYCSLKPSKAVIKMTSDAIRRADGEGSCQAVKNVLSKLDKGVH